jgi:hypothetical protein
VEGAALKIGNTNLFLGSKIYPTPLNAIGFSLYEKIPLEVVVNGSKKFLENTTF